MSNVATCLGYGCYSGFAGMLTACVCTPLGPKAGALFGVSFYGTAMAADRFLYPRLSKTSEAAGRSLCILIAFIGGFAALKLAQVPITLASAVILSVGCCAAGDIAIFAQQKIRKLLLR